MTNETLAAQGGTQAKTKPFPVWPYSDSRELELVTEVVKSRKWWRMTGSKVTEFEKKFADFHNTEYCLAVTNGTHAIELLLAAAGIGAGDEVILPGFTFISTMTAPLYCNATPIPVDVDPGTFCIDPKAIENAITEKTKAIIPVHMAGHVCDMEAICEIAEKHNLIVIEDAAHAHGAEWKNKKVGTFSTAAIFSFQNGKIVTSGEGGAFITNDKDLYEKAFLIHGVGRPMHDRVYKHLELGSNYRMSELQAAVLIAQLERLDDQNKKREENAALLDSFLSEVKGILPQTRKNEVTINTHYMYMFYYDKNEFGGMDRLDFVDNLIAEGVPAFIAYPVVSRTEFFKENNFRSHQRETVDYKKFVLPNAEKIADEVIWLPHQLLLGDEKDMQEIADAVIKIQRAAKN